MLSPNKIHRFALFAVVALGALTVGAQQYVPQWQIDAGGQAKFDIASVKPDRAPKSDETTHSNVTLDGSNVFAPTGGLFSAVNYDLVYYIGFAYKLQGYEWLHLRAQLPKWINSVQYDIQARVSDSPTKDQYRLMMQSLLEGRFKLATHYETRQLPVYAMVLEKQDKLGPQLKPHSEDPPCSSGPAANPPPTIAGGFPEPCGSWLFWGGSGRWHAGGRNMTIAMIAAYLPGMWASAHLDLRPFLDKTGLTGRYDFVMSWTPQFDPPLPAGADFQPDPTGPTFVEALKDQLGLKLVSQTGPVDMLVIDHVEEPSPN